MKKGRVKIIPVETPQVDMPVIMENNNKVYKIWEIDNEKGRVKLSYKVINEVTDKVSVYNPLFKELRHLVVEYDEQTYDDSDGKPLSPKPQPIIKQRPLMIKQWQYVLDNNLIGVFVGVIPYSIGDFKDTTNTELTAQICVLESKTYTEEEVQAKIQKFCDDYLPQRGVVVLGDTVKDWWTLNK